MREQTGFSYAQLNKFRERLCWNNEIDTVLAHISTFFLSNNNDISLSETLYFVSNFAFNL